MFDGRAGVPYVARHLLSERSSDRDTEMITLTWLPSWQAYAIRKSGRMVGLVRCHHPFPFRATFAFA